MSAFLRVRSDRARLALAAILPVLADAQSGPAQLTGAARRLLDDVAACPADGYARSSLSSWPARPGRLQARHRMGCTSHGLRWR